MKAPFKITPIQNRYTSLLTFVDKNFLKLVNHCQASTTFEFSTFRTIRYVFVFLKSSQLESAVCFLAFTDSNFQTRIFSLLTHADVLSLFLNHRPQNTPTTTHSLSQNTPMSSAKRARNLFGFKSATFNVTPWFQCYPILSQRYPS